MTEVRPQGAEDEEKKKKEEAEAREAVRRRREGERRAKEDKKVRANKEDTAKKVKKAAEDEEDKTAKTPIPFGDARLIAKAVTTIQDEKQLVLTPDEFAGLKKILEEYGNYHVKYVESLSEAQIVVLSQAVLRKSEIAEPKEEDFESPAGSKERKNEEALAKLEIKEVREGEELTADKIRKGKLLQISQQPVEAEPAGEAETEGDETPGMVETYPHIANMTYEVAAETLKAAGIDAELPGNWDRRNELDRFQVLERLGVFNTTAFPQRETERTDDLRFIDGVTGAEVYEDKGDGYSITNYTSYRRPNISIDDVNRFLKAAGADKEVEEPQGWGKMKPQEQREWLKEKGVRIMANLEGGAVAWSDNTTVDAKTVYMRLKQLRDEEGINPAAFAASGKAADRDELFDRLRDLQEDRVPDLADLHPYQLLSAFQSLKEFEDARGVAAFNSANLNQDRSRVINLLIAKYGFSQVFQDLMNPPAGIERTALEKYRKTLLDMVDERSATGLPDKMWQDFGFVGRLNASLQELEKISRGVTPTALPQLNAAVSQVQRNRVKHIYEEMDNHFKIENDKLDRSTRNSLYGAVDKMASELIQTVRSRFMRIEDAERELMRVAAVESSKEVGALTGILEWRAAKHVEEMRVALEVERNLVAPLDWNESMTNALNNVRSLESQDFTQEDVGRFRNNINQILDNIPVDQLEGTEKEEALELQREINSIKDSVIAIFSLRLTMEGFAMDPDKILETIMGNNLWKEDTWRVFFSRFFKDQNGEEFEDNHGGKFNILDVGMKLYFERFAGEKRRMNYIEGLSLVDITSPLGDIPDEIMTLFPHFTVADLAGINEMRQKMVERVTSLLGRQGKPVTPGSINEYWSNPNNAREAVWEWYDQETLLGAHGLDARSGKKNLDIKREEQLSRLEGELLAKGIKPEKIEEWRNAGLLHQVNNNAYNLTWTMGAFSDYDGIRLYDREKNWFVNDRGEMRKQLGAFCYSKYSDIWHGRMLDHYSEFLHDEVRGRPQDANLVFQKHQLGRRRGLLGHNRLMIKFINDLLRNDESDIGNADTYIPSLLVAGGGVSFADLLNQKMESLDNIGKLDMGKWKGPGSTDWDGGVAFDRGWARGVALEELVDDVQLDFSRIRWSEVFSKEKTNIIKYNMGDWWTDRKESKKYFASDSLQAYLNHPNTKNFMEINNRKQFYSTRQIRIHPWMKLTIPAHQEIGKHWKEWWDLETNLPSAEVEDLIRVAVQTNRLDPKEGEWMKKKHLGIGPIPGFEPVRRMKQYLQMIQVMGQEFNPVKKKGLYMGFFMTFLWAMFTGIFKQSSAQMQGK